MQIAGLLINIMVLILDDNLEPDAHILSVINHLICLRHLIAPIVVVEFDFSKSSRVRDVF